MTYSTRNAIDAKALLAAYDAVIADIEQLAQGEQDEIAFVLERLRDLRADVEEEAAKS